MQVAVQYFIFEEAGKSSVCYGNQSWNFHKENLSEEVNYTSGLSYEEYRNELKLRVGQGDEEAAKALSLSNEIISYLNKRENGKQEAEGDNLLEH